MSNENNNMQVFLDVLPNSPRDDQTRKEFERMLRQEFESQLPKSVERIWELPPIVLKEPFGEYVDLLLETRQLFLAGHFYSCVAMCGIVGERLIKDVLRASVRIEKDGQVNRPQDKAFDQFERVDVNSIVKFLKESRLLCGEAAKAADDLGQLRNSYAHARGKAPEADAIKAIKYLHTLVEDTVSVFKNFEIKDGVFVKKKPPE